MRNVTDVLILEGLVPEDSEILSSHNNLVLKSQKERIVLRIGKISAIAAREDPGDVAYSHALAYRIGNEGSVLPPINALPQIEGDFIISTFPLIENPVWTEISGDQLLDMNNSFQEAYYLARSNVGLRDLDIPKYARERLSLVEADKNADTKTVEEVLVALETLESAFPFSELKEDDLSLVHGDLHSGNVLQNDEDELRIIDLDSIAQGPRLYDLASWNIRRLRGDIAPIDEAVGLARSEEGWDEEAFRALMAWKLISSMTHTLRYEAGDAILDNIRFLQGLGKTATGLTNIFEAKYDS